MIDGLKKKFTSMGKPKQLFSDGESSMRFAKMVEFISQNDIKFLQTSTHAHTVERFSRTFKDNLYRRLDALKQTKSDWFKHMDNIIRKYNSTEHSIIQVKPNEAGKKRKSLLGKLAFARYCEKQSRIPNYFAKRYG